MFKGLLIVEPHLYNDPTHPANRAWRTEQYFLLNLEN